MRTLTVMLFMSICHLTGASEQDKQNHELNAWNTFQARYKIHSGGTAYSESPTQSDRVLTFALRDETARQVFEQIGPDVKPVCDDTKGYRVREKKGVYRSFTPLLANPRNSHYRCWIGIDLRTGEGDLRVSC